MERKTKERKGTFKRCLQRKKWKYTDLDVQTYRLTKYLERRCVKVNCLRNGWLQTFLNFGVKSKRNSIIEIKWNVFLLKQRFVKTKQSKVINDESGSQTGKRYKFIIFLRFLVWKAISSFVYSIRPTFKQCYHQNLSLL